MNTKIFSLICFLMITYCCSIFAQHQFVYTAPNNRFISSISGYDNVYNNDKAFYIDIGGNSVTRESPYWIRWYRQNNAFSNSSHSDFLNGSTCFHGQGGYAWSKVGYFTKSTIDTSFMISRWDWFDCQWNESGYSNRISYNSGLNTTNLQNIGMFAFEIDNQDDNLIYGIGGVYLSPAKLWKSTNKGINWSGIDPAGPPFNSHAFIRINPLKHNTIIVASNMLWKSYDGGASIGFTSNLPVYSNSLTVDAVDTAIYICNEVHGIYKSTNGGVNFQQSLDIGCNVLQVNPDNHNIVYAGTIDGLYRSTNGGNNWKQYFDFYLKSRNVTGIVKYKNDRDTIFVSNNSSVYKIWETIVSINTLNNTIPVSFDLLQNYPNPFNPVTKIKFDIPLEVRGQTSNVKLIVYNSLGKEVMTLVNEKLNAGSYEVDFDGSNLSSGTYFYKLIVDSSRENEIFSETKSMVLLK